MPFCAFSIPALHLLSRCSLDEIARRTGLHFLGHAWLRNCIDKLSRRGLVSEAGATSVMASAGYRALSEV